MGSVSRPLLAPCFPAGAVLQERGAMPVRWQEGHAPPPRLSAAQPLSDGAALSRFLPSFWALLGTACPG
jgi:hypothetical protein